MKHEKIVEIFDRYRKAIIDAYDNKGGFPIAKFYVDEILEQLEPEGENLFNDESNAGNTKRAELIAYYKGILGDDWDGGYSQGFADCFNWLNSLKLTPQQPSEGEIEEFLIHKVTSCTITEEADLDDYDNHYYNHKDLISALKGLNFLGLIDDKKINAAWEQFSFKLSQVVTDNYSVMEESDFKAAIKELLNR